MIILRYLSKEIIKTSLAVVGLLVIIALSNKFTNLISHAAMGEIPPGLLFSFIALQIPEILAFLLPLGLFLSLILALGKLYVDNEMTAYFACGFNWGSLVKLTMILASVVMLFSMVLTLWVVPTLADVKEKLVQEQESTLLLKTLTPGRFHSLKKDRVVFYVEELSSDRKNLKKVFIAEEPAIEPSKDNLWGVLTANSGRVVRNKDGQLYVELLEGQRYEGLPGALNYSIVHFNVYGRLIEETPIQTSTLRYHRNTPTLALIGSTNTSNQAELQWRLAVPFSAIILSLLALPLASIPPRRGRFARVLPAIIVFIVYFNLLTVCKRAVANGKLPSWIGLWWVELGVLIIAIIWLFKISGYFASRKGQSVST